MGAKSEKRIRRVVNKFRNAQKVEAFNELLDMNFARRLKAALIILRGRKKAHGKEK